MNLKLLKLAASALLLIPAGPALAASVLPTVLPANWPTIQPIVFNFTTGNNNNIQDGNARFYTATSPDLFPITVKVTGWSLEKTSQGTFVRDSKLMVYSGGLGVISGDDDNGADNQHTMDNDGRRDFMILQFNAPVRLLSATFNTYSVLGKTKDSDATIKWGTTQALYNSALGLDGKTESYLNSLFSGTHESLSPNGDSNTRALNANSWGNLWLIGSSFTNADRKIDGFKLTNLAVVPEPGTWAMLIVGFGAAGTAMRSARRRERLAAA